MASNGSVIQCATSDGAGVTLETLIEEHFDYLYRYAYRYFRCQDRAEELVQETCLAAAESISRFEGKSSPRTWLTGILRHKIMDKLRSMKQEERFVHQENEQEDFSAFFDEAEHWRSTAGPLVWGSDPDRVLGQKQFMSVLEGCLKKLPGRVRQIFLLREMEGFDREQICAELDLTSTNVGVILYRARLYLQQCLQTHWFKNTALGGAE